MLARSALLLSFTLLVAGAGVAPSVLNLYSGKGTIDLAEDGEPCAPAGSPLLVNLGVANGANERLSSLVAPGEGGAHVGSGATPNDPLVSTSCVLVWNGILAGTASTGFTGTAFHHLGADPDCVITVAIGPLGPATPVSIEGCGGALSGEGTLDFGPFLTG